MQSIVDLADNTRVYDVASVTPLSLAHQLSERSKTTSILNEKMNCQYIRLS